MRAIGSRFRDFPRYIFDGRNGIALVNFNDFSCLYQDSAGATPVTAVGQPVGKILDRSGGGHHAVQATSSKRPTLQRDAQGLCYLDFDGVDDSLQVAAYDMGVSVATLYCGFYHTHTTGAGVLFERSPDTNLNSGAFSFIPYENGLTTTGAACVSGGIDVVKFTTAVSANTKCTVGIKYDLNQTTPQTRNTCYKNNAIAPMTNVYDGTNTTGTFNSKALNIGMRDQSAYPYKGRLYGMLFIGADMSADEHASCFRYINGLTGAY